MDVVEGYKDTKIGRIPKDWEVTQLGELCEVITKGTTPTTNGFSYLEDGINFVKVESIDSFGGFIEKMFAYVGEDCHKSFKRSQLQEGDILISIAGALGRTAIVTNNILPANTNQAVGILRLEDKSLNRFIRYFLDSNYLQKFIERINVASAQANLNLGHLNKFHIAFPPLSEQQKIAEILSTVDEQISTTQAIIDKSKELKKGLMQKLFSEGIGHTEYKIVNFRPKKHKAPKDWKVMSIEETSSLKGRIGWQGLTTKEYLSKGDYFLITGTDFKNGSIDWKHCHYVPKDRFDQDLKIQIKENDILITKDGTIGKIAIVSPMPNKPGTLNSGVFVLRPTSNDYLPNYMYYYLTSYLFSDFISKIKAGSTIAHLYQKDFVKYEFLVPPLLEQQKIAEILSEADAKIEKEEQQKAKLGELKKGLMQQLLTGKKRVA